MLKKSVPEAALLLMLVLNSSAWATVHVELACVAATSPPVNTALAYHGPAFEAAVAEANRLYRGLFEFTLSFMTGNGTSSVYENISVADEALPMHTADWYYRSRRTFPNGILAFITPGMASSTDILQLTANWGILFVSTVGSRESSTTLPSPIYLGAAYVSTSDIGRMVIEFLQLFNWTTAFVVVDSNAPPVYKTMAVQAEKYASGTAIRILKRTISLDLRPSYLAVLDEFVTMSRILVFLGRAEKLRKLLVEASVRNMTAGDFVYLWDEPYPYPPSYGNLSWSLPNDTDNSVAREAFRSLFVLGPYDLDESSASSLITGQLLLDQLRTRALQTYRVPAGTPFTLPVRDVLTSYSTVLILAQVLNESLHEDRLNCVSDAHWFLQQFLNRTFTIPGGFKVYVDPTGTRRVPLGLSHFAGPIPVRQIIYAQSSDDGFLMGQVGRVIPGRGSWPEKVWPPPSEPFCGHSGNRPTCNSASGLIHVKQQANHDKIESNLI
ncbi:hypothetical protein BV898_12141 [Hypsibius exemplaris]|uniref:Receptor ligand binding region domain-containing protein n=1 Tax=Hypsibius exemplaris TaxID=2072580 RepID=A0A1W0WEI6_HYPEX|nr:hypothetical protein BV898_12141 [Hypsibius exemplaris]